MDSKCAAAALQPGDPGEAVQTVKTIIEVVKCWRFPLNPASNTSKAAHFRGILRKTCSKI